MDTKDFLAYIVDKIHSTVVATVDQEGRPVTCAIDMMDYDQNSLYFLTAKGKQFYHRLKQKEWIAFTAMKGEDTMSCVAVSLQGKVRELGPGRIPALFEKNPYMKLIYPTEESRRALTVFQIYEGVGEWFDLRKLPIEREAFVLGGAEDKPGGYFIGEKCTGCGICLEKCPQNCIDTGKKPALIRQRHCILCGNCYEACPEGAVEEQGGIF